MISIEDPTVTVIGRTANVIVANFIKSALTQGVPDLSNHYLNLPNNSKNTT
jgi:hypothetical protein